ncbi:MAG: hypothetical protein QOF58_7662 [Pseudonocardiales bacterium]|nr:hypothetical protein [Pseudonocardiales bacterium]
MYDDVRTVVEEFEYTGDIQALLTADLPPPHECPPDLLMHLAQAHWYQFQAQSGFLGLIDREIATAIAGKPGDPVVAAVRLMPEYTALEEAYEEFLDYQDSASLTFLANAYTTLMEAVGDERMKAAMTADHAKFLLLLDELDGTTTYRDVAVKGMNWVLQHTPRDDPQRARRHLDRARALINAGRRPGEVLADYREAARLALRERPVWRDILLELAQYQHDLYANGGPTIHLCGALATCRDLADALERDFGNVNTLPVLAQVEQEVGHQVGAPVARFLLTCHRDPQVLRAQHDLVADLKLRQVTDEVLVGRRDQAWILAVGLPLDHEGRMEALLDLYHANMDLWEIAGDTDAATFAYDAAIEALVTTSPDDLGRARLLRAFSHSATVAAARTGSAYEARLGVDAARTALELPVTDAYERPLRLTSLASALITQFDLGGNPAAGQEAITILDEAIAATPADDTNLPLRWTTLSTTVQQVAAKTRDHAMFAKAVNAGAQAVATIAADDVRRIGMLYNYATAVQVQAVGTQTTDAEPFREAERAYRAALALVGPQHPDVPRIESTIADLLYYRYQQCGDLDALDDSLELAQKAVAETPQDHHWWPLRAFALARSARELAKFGGPRADELRQLAITYYRAVGAHPASGELRMQSEHAQAAMLAEADPATWLAAQERVIAVIPASVSRALPRDRRMAAVRQLDGLADRVVDAGVRSGQLGRAVELVEQCRGVLFGDAWGIRRGWARLREVAPRYAEKLADVEKKLGSADAHVDIAEFHVEVSFRDKTSSRRWDPRPQAVEQIRQLAAERDQLLSQIRSLPGFEDLLAPSTLEELRTRLNGHTAVMVSAAGTALVVPADHRDPVFAVPLRMTETAARAQVRKLRAALADVKDPACSFDRREQAQLDVHAVLEWLWDTTASPVLERVTAARVWWCPVGIAAQLPLHAAGHHRAGISVFDRVVSSYTPSLTALADTLSTPWPRHSRPTALVVGVGDGEPALPNARTEAELVAGLVPGSTVLLDSAASAQAITDGLHEHTIAHFACHGRAVSSAKHPGQGGLVLSEGNGMFVPTFVRDLRITQAQLAFLSACDTAGPDPALVDEPLNLASAFHLAGFRSVIGTLWHTADSAETASAVYSTLTAGGTEPADTTAAAFALNETLRRMRDAYPAVPTRWAAHVHVGG